MKKNISSSFFISLLVGLNFICLTNSALAYNLWKDANPFIKIKVPKSQTSALLNEVDIILKCPYAEEYKLADELTFKNAQWHKLSENVKWKFYDADEITTVYAIFRKSNPNQAGKSVTKIVHDTIDRKSTYKKITRQKNGYVDWTDLKIITETYAYEDHQTKKRYFSSKTQQKAETVLFKTTFDIFKELPINDIYKVKDLLAITPALYDRILKHTKNISIKDIEYPNNYTIYLLGELNIYNRKIKKKLNREDALIQFLKPNLKIRTQVPKNYETSIHALIVDTRGFQFEPYLFPEIISKQQENIIHPQHHTDTFVPYARYIRSIDELSSLKDLLEKNITIKQRNQNSQSLIIKADHIKTDEKHKIIISDRYVTLLQDMGENAKQIANGNFYIIID